MAGVGFSRADARRVAAATRHVEGQLRGLQPPRRGRWQGGPALLPARTSSAVTAASLATTTITYGAGTVKLYELSGATMPLGATDFDLINPIAEAVATDTFCWVAPWGGALILVGWDCG